MDEDGSAADSLRGRIFYDAECSACRRLVERFGARLRSAGFAFVALQDPGSTAALRIREDERLAEMRVLTAEGRLYGGADAVVYLAAWLRWGWLLRVLAAAPGMRRVLRAVYRRIAARRGCAAGTCALDVPRRVREGPRATPDAVPRRERSRAPASREAEQPVKGSRS